jgi:2-iminobutanoate/2-iminopropanoate deaminase
MTLRIVSTNGAPEAIGPYSQAIAAESAGLVFCSGQIALDPATGQIVGDDVRGQTEQVMRNLGAVLEAAGSSLERTVKITVYLKNMGDFTDFNEVYASFFQSNRPARATIEVSNLPKDALVELDAVAVAE